MSVSESRCTVSMRTIKAGLTVKNSRKSKKNNQSNGTDFKKLLMVFALMLALMMQADATKAQSTDSLIIYGGMGHLSNKAQPVFGSVFEGKISSAKNYRRETEAFLAKVISQSDFSWTKNDVIFDYEDANAVMKHAYAKNGAEWTNLRPNLDQLIEEAERVYVLAVVADLELHIKSPPITDGADYLDLMAASATAVLVDMSTKEIILSDTHLEHQLLSSSEGFLPESEVNNVLLHAYKKSAGAAILKLADKMKNASPSAAFDRHMVTGTMYPGPRAQAMFGLEPWGKKVESICSLPVQCDSETGICSKLAALTTSVTSRAFSDAGQLILPSAGWTYWADRSTNLVSLRLLQPRGSVLEETLAIKLPPETAEIKVIAELHVSEPRIVRNSDDADKALWVGTRYDKALINVRRFETEFDNCKKVTAVPDLISAEGTNSSLATAKFNDPELSIQQLYVFKAILDAGENLVAAINEKIKDD